MMLIVDTYTGEVVSRSESLRGVREYCSKHAVKHVVIKDETHSRDNKPELVILFENGCRFACDFASFQVLKQVIRRWKNLDGANLWVNNCDMGYDMKVLD